MSVLSTPRDEIRYEDHAFKSNHFVKTSSLLQKLEILFTGVIKLYLFRIKVLCNTLCFKCILFTPK